MSDYDPNSPRDRTCPPRSEQDLRAIDRGRFKRHWGYSASLASVCARLANFCNYVKAGTQAKGPASTDKEEMPTHRRRGDAGSHDRAFRRSPGVPCGIGRATGVQPRRRPSRIRRRRIQRRSGPAAGGSSGTVTSVSKSAFTMTTSAGQKVTVDESSSTKYKEGSSTIRAGAIKKGTHVLVIGTVSSTTIKATQVVVQAGDESVASTAATVVPFQKGAPTTSKQVGQIPTTYTEGSGTIQSGTTATKATEAALASYPGGVVDRVVKLSNGEYEVHTIGVNWPHHIFVNQDFKVVGAE